jgi:uncharacterized protein (UPF0335 family)
MTTKGHNSDGIAHEQLRGIVERVERLQEEKDAIGADIREVFAEAKANGFDAKILRQVIKERAMDPDDRAERDTVLDLYRRALGMV